MWPAAALQHCRTTRFFRDPILRLGFPLLQLIPFGEDPVEKEQNLTRHGRARALPAQRGRHPEKDRRFPTP